jgi:hypothetical protein
VLRDGEVIPYETVLIDTEPPPFSPDRADRVAHLVAAHHAAVGDAR